MSSRHPTRTMYCQHSTCPNADGIEVAWYPDSIEGPGWPYRDTCPLCDADLGMEPREPDEEVQE